jgi:hypothetical protein
VEERLNVEVVLTMFPQPYMEIIGGVQAADSLWQ